MGTYEIGLLIPNQSSEKEIQYCFEIISYGPSIYRMHQPDFIVYSFMGTSIGLKRVKVVKSHSVYFRHSVKSA